MADLAELPLWLQAGTYASENDRMLLRALIDSEGVTGSQDLKVSQHSTPAMSVDVAAGIGFVPRTGAAVPDFYSAESQALTTLTIATSDATNARIDIVILRVYDASYSGALNKATLEVITGNPAATPVAPSTPANSIVLAQVTVPHGATSIVNANIADFRPHAKISLRRLVSDNAADVGLSVQLAASATGDALQVLNSSGTVIAKIDSAGKIIATNLPADTGWTTVTGIAASGWNVSTSPAIAEYRTYNGWIKWNLHVGNTSAGTLTGGATGNCTDTDIATLPVGTRPGRALQGISWQGGNTFGTAQIGTGGVVTITTMHGTGSIANGDTVHLNVPSYVPES